MGCGTDNITDVVLQHRAKLHNSYIPLVLTVTIHLKLRIATVRHNW